MPSYGSAGIRGDGSSANAGNQISGRSSTRVAQNPGGNSSFSLGWGDPANATKKVHHQPTYAPSQQVFGTGSGTGYPSSSAQPSYGASAGGYQQVRSAYGNAPPAAQPNYRSSDYVPKSLNTYQAAPPPQQQQQPRMTGGDALESMAGGPLNSSPITRRREQRSYAQLQPTAISPKVARAAQASMMRESSGYGQSQPTGAYGQRGSRVSGNSYANGSSQNTGNVITDRSSTRVAQNPGGNSSFSIGWGDSSATAPRGQAAPRQPAPYGNSHNQQQFQQAPPPQQQHRAAPYGQTPSYNAPPNAGGSIAFGANPDRMRGSSNAFANGASQNTGNFISDRSSTRIHAPPGGRSTFTLG